MDSVHNKEPLIHAQAIMALSKLADSEDISDLGEDEASIMEFLLDSLTYDTSTDVRRVALANIPLTPRTLPLVLARFRDVDPAMRKLVYSHVLEPHCTLETSIIIGPTHPRALSIAQRELIARNGLGDRDESVKVASGKLFATWLDVLHAEGVKRERDEEEGARGNVVAFLHLFDLAEGKVAEDALLSVFATRVYIFDNVDYDSKEDSCHMVLSKLTSIPPDNFWTSLSPERARVFVDHCIATKDDARLESPLLVVIALAFRIQATHNDLLQLFQQEEEYQLLRGAMDDPEEEQRARKEERRIDVEFVIGEMLKLAVNLDYADDIGQRKMFQLIHEWYDLA